MAEHTWGDDWKHWGTLNTAIAFIYKTFEDRTLHTISMKEKYGTVRYEFINPIYDRPEWYSQTLLWDELKKVVKEATIKWPEIKEELIEDLID